MEIVFHKHNSRRGDLSLIPIALPVVVAAIVAAVLSEKWRVACGTLSLIAMSVVCLELWRINKGTPIYRFDDEGHKAKIKQFAQGKGLTLSEAEATFALHAFKEIRAFSKGREIRLGDRLFKHPDGFEGHYLFLGCLFDQLLSKGRGELEARQFCEAFLEWSDRGNLTDLPSIDGWKIIPGFEIGKVRSWDCIPRLRDEATGKEYLFETKSFVRYKCYLLAIVSPLVHLWGLPLAMVCSGFRLIARKPREGGAAYGGASSHYRSARLSWI